jgi:3-dehydroquinate dehydratase
MLRRNLISDRISPNLPGRPKLMVPGRAALVESETMRREVGALPDMARAFKELLIETYLSNIYHRETFRQHSHVSLAARAVLPGFGPRGCRMAHGAPVACFDDAS